MKKLAYHAVIMAVIIILLPLAIVKGCGSSPGKEEPPEKTAKAGDYKISVYVASMGEVAEFDLEEYIKGVVAAEMPADFDLEALKAQAVAARTYAYGRMAGVFRSKQGYHDGIEICTDSSHCQAWVAKKDAMKKWGLLFAARNWRKIESAVNGTKGLIVVYRGGIANALFHSSSPGRTENAEDVWPGTYVPYLRSVESEGEEKAAGYITEITVGTGEIAGKIRNFYPDANIKDISADDIKILALTEGLRVKTVKVGNIMMKGTEFRNLLGLRSACFKVEQVEDDLVRITTTGFGHGVGMSQWGADSLAKKGGSFEEILKHYYTGVDIVPISLYEAGGG